MDQVILRSNGLSANRGLSADKMERDGKKLGNVSYNQVAFNLSLHVKFGQRDTKVRRENRKEKVFT